MYCHKGLWKWKDVSIFIDALLPNPLEYIKNNFTIVKCNLYLYICLNLPVLLPTNCKDERTAQQVYSPVNTACAQRIKSAAEYDQNNLANYSWSSLPCCYMIAKTLKWFEDSIINQIDHIYYNNQIENVALINNSLNTEIIFLLSLFLFLLLKGRKPIQCQKEKLFRLNSGYQKNYFYLITDLLERILSI